MIIISSFLFPFNVPGFPTRVKTDEQKNTQKHLVG